MKKLLVLFAAISAVLTVAKADEKLLDDYRALLELRETPGFYLQSSDPVLENHFKQFFIDKGFFLVNNEDDAEYRIRLSGSFQDRPTPGVNGSTGTILTLTIEVLSIDDSISLMKLTDRQAKDSAIMSAEERRDDVARRLAKKLESRLHKAVNDMVVKVIVGSEVDDPQ